MNSLIWSLLLLAGALVVVGIELFIPSAGLLAVLATALFIASIVVAFFHSAMTGVGVILAIAVLLPFLFTAFVRLWPHTPIGRRVLIQPPRKEELLPEGEGYDDLEQLVGRRGVAKTPMLPSGLVQIEGRKYDAISQGAPVDAGDRIEVVAIKTRKIIVRKVGEDEPETRDRNIDPDDILSRPVEDFLS